MGIKAIYERFVWFDHQVRAIKMPDISFVKNKDLASITYSAIS